MQVVSIHSIVVFSCIFTRWSCSIIITSSIFKKLALFSKRFNCEKIIFQICVYYFFNNKSQNINIIHIVYTIYYIVYLVSVLLLGSQKERTTVGLDNMVVAGCEQECKANFRFLFCFFKQCLFSTSLLTSY